MPIKRILLATDGSKESDHARRWAEVIATRFAARVLALSVLEATKPDTLRLPSGLKGTISRVDSQILKAEQRRLRRVSEGFKKKGIHTEIRISRGAAYEEIVRIAANHRTDLIVMGKRGLTPYGRMLLGSTSSAVLRAANVPVLTVRRPPAKVAIKKILFPTAFSPTDTAALTCAFGLAKKFGSALHFLHVMEVHKSYDKVKGGFIGKLRDSAAKQLHAMVESIPPDKREKVALMEKIAASSRAWTRIIGYAREESIDMIVMGTQARKGVPRLFLGSVAENVVNESPCPVITVGR